MEKKQFASLILYDEAKRILLQHRTDDAPTLPGHWAFFGGQIEQGETPEQAVKREALEELGYALSNPRFWTAQQFIHQECTYIQHLFLEKYDGRVLVLGEGQGMGWFLAAETKDLPMSPHARLIVEALEPILAW
jgi:8-oxo-dGTP diphosphatase